jgi:hypothetical protein
LKKIKGKTLTCQQVIARKRQIIERKIEAISKILGEDLVFVRCSPVNGKLRCTFTFQHSNGGDETG